VYRIGVTRKQSPNYKGKRNMQTMLTYDGRDILTIPSHLCETVVYEVQKRVDKIAREQNKPHGKIVSTRRL
jgi:hypothetical protein